jgi:hypothetical protein
MGSVPKSMMLKTFKNRGSISENIKANYSKAVGGDVSQKPNHL